MRAALAAAVLFITVAVFIALGVALARAHEWYPVSCCSGIDCEPIKADRVRSAPGGYQIDGRFFVPQKDVRFSPDGQYHACFPTPDKLKCFWAPVPSF